MKIILYSIFFLLFSTSFVNDDKIAWSHAAKLTWADFQGIPESGSNFVASTNSGMSLTFSYSEQNGKLTYDFDIKGYFYPKLSWFKQQGASDYILTHEQTHFDITELHTRKFRKRMSDTTFSSTIKQEVQVIYEQTELERKQMQQRFDTETNHSQNKNSEIEWRNFVAAQLELYDGWK